MAHPQLERELKAGFGHSFQAKPLANRRACPAVQASGQNCIWRRALWTFALVLVSAICLQTGEAQLETERVGDWGGEERLVFEGNQTFSRDNILNTLATSFEFHARSYPAAPLAEYLAWIEKTVWRGYQRSGFAQARVKVQADPQSHRIRVDIAEGPCFLGGDIKVSGLNAALAELLKTRLREAATMRTSETASGGPGFVWCWCEGRPISADPEGLADSERRVVAALAELNYHLAKVQVELALRENHRADVLIHIVDPGLAGVLDQIKVTGLKTNAREELLAFLGLRPGMALTGNVTNDVIRRLWDSGRFLTHSAKLSPLAEPGRFRLDIDVVECPAAPSLGQELTPEERACLKLREWMAHWQDRSEDWVVEAETMRNGRRLQGALVLGKEGLVFAARQSGATNRLLLHYALIVAPGQVGLYSGPQHSKLVGKDSRMRTMAFVNLAGQPGCGRKGISLTFGAGCLTGPKEVPFTFCLKLAPVVFLEFAHPDEAICRVEGGILSIRNAAATESDIALSSEAATGRLIRLETGNSESRHLAVRCEAGALARVVREIAAEGASFTNALDPRHPWHSSLAFLGRDLTDLLKAEFPEIQRLFGESFAAKLRPEEAWNLLATLGELPWGELLAPLERVTSLSPEEAEQFPLVLDRPVSASPSDEWLRVCGGALLRASDALWPRGSWPWAVLREAAFAAGGEYGYATNELDELVHSGKIGPLGCLVAAHTLGRFNPRLAVPLVQQGARHAKRRLYGLVLDAGNTHPPWSDVAIPYATPTWLPSLPRFSHCTFRRGC